jgi:hypothetical protein
VVDVSIYKLLMQRYPGAHPDKTFAELVDATELAEITRKAEAMAETSLKFLTEASSSLVSSPDGRQFHHRDGRKSLQPSHHKNGLRSETLPRLRRPVDGGGSLSHPFCVTLKSQ